jgi:hypothetical protein
MDHMTHDFSLISPEFCQVKLFLKLGEVKPFPNAFVGLLVSP